MPALAFRLRKDESSAPLPEAPRSSPGRGYNRDMHRPSGPSAKQVLVAFGAAAVLLAVYAPVLRLGPVGEDLQWAYKGWLTPSHPSGWLHPFHHHFRPTGRIFFTVAAHLFGDHWWLYRLAALSAAAILAVVAHRVLRHLFGLSTELAGVALILWLASPLADEVLFVTNQVKQVFYATGVLLVLLLRAAPVPRRWSVLAAALLAFCAKEEAVVLLPLVFLQDWMLLGQRPWNAVRRSLPWVAGTALYLIVYRVLVHFEAGWFYSSPWLAAPNLATTWTAFWHLHSPVLGRYLEALAGIWPLVLGAGVLTVLALAFALRHGHREVAFGMVASVVALGPTLPANLQVPRYTFLAYLFFLGAVLAAGAALSRLVPHRWVTVPLALTLAAVGANDALTARADRQDWERYAALTRQLRSEVGPLLEELRDGREVVVIRDRDQGPLRRLLADLRGVPKVFFPRPDDPYGVTSLSAAACWHLRKEGLAAPRILEIPPAAAFFLHTRGGFVRLVEQPSPRLEPFGHGVVVLRPLPAAAFDPGAFP